MEHVSRLVWDYYDAKTVTAVMSFSDHAIMNIGWQPPSGNYVKLNTDGPSKENSIAGCGGIIKGNQGEWLRGFAKGVGVCSAFVAELWGVHEGLLYAWRLGFTAVKLNIDSIAVVDAIKNGRKSSSIRNSLVKQIRRSLELDWDIKIVHAYRESNKCADALANIGCTLDREIIHYDSCPNQIRNLVLDDEMGITPRIIPM
ncbi:putative non-LTR retroelement reverse transcriptase [Trifolium medium]|uniref:Putative non-LTR retroelement reverse transcriptase n=1 Tax=Trifolium medium TaxID=97028 RepID=A0A392MH43_9FABA|nr:putative non-LTR retroelement reverse transcriptase [Trifolium medium]